MPAPGDALEIGQLLARRLRLFDAERDELGTVRYHGRDGGLRFHLSYTLPDPALGRAAETLVEVQPEAPPLPASFTLFPRASNSPSDLAESVSTGDRLFDRRWVVSGDRVAILSALGRDTRALVARSSDVSVSAGWLYMRVAGLNLDLEAVEAQVRHALNLARTLAVGLARSALSTALLENLRAERGGHVRLNLTRALLDHEPSAANEDDALDFWLAAYPTEQRATVRRELLAFFLERARDNPRTTELLRKGLLDASPDIRLIAARNLGEEGFDTVIKVATTRFASEGTRIDALHYLGEGADAARFREALALCARDEATRVRRYAVRRLLEDPTADLVETLARVAKGADREAAEDLAELLGALPAELSQPALLVLLANRSGEVKRAAARSLGQVGTVAAVPALLALAKPIILDGSLRDLAHDAILRIQYRIQNGEAGGLALVEAGEQAGGLSVPEDEPGALSFVPSSPSEAP